jgi:hypothetical protein
LEFIIWVRKELQSHQSPSFNITATTDVILSHANIKQGYTTPVNVNERFTKILILTLYEHVILFPFLTSESERFSLHYIVPNYTTWRKHFQLFSFTIAFTFSLCSNVNKVNSSERNTAATKWQQNGAKGEKKDRNA